MKHIYGMEPGDVYWAASDVGWVVGHSYIDDDGYVYVMGRVDDVINVSGHRLSTGAMEEIISTHPDVAECAVVGVNDNLKGQVPIGFVVLKTGASKAPLNIVADLVQSLRTEIRPIACFKQATVVDRLPKTRYGKILRGTMRKIADAEDYKAPSTIDDPTILNEIAESVKTIGYGK